MTTKFHYLANEQETIEEILRGLDVEAEIVLVDDADAWWVLVEIKYTDNDGNYTAIYAGMLERAKHEAFINDIKWDVEHS